MERLARHPKPVAILRARCITIWFVNQCRYVRAWGALVGDVQRLVGNIQRRMKESVPIFNRLELSLDRIVEDVLRITYVYVATVDGRLLIPPPRKSSGDGRLLVPPHGRVMVPPYKAGQTPGVYTHPSFGL